MIGFQVRSTGLHSSSEDDDPDFRDIAFPSDTAMQNVGTMHPQKCFGIFLAMFIFGIYAHSFCLGMIKTLTGLPMHQCVHNYFLFLCDFHF